MAVAVAVAVAVGVTVGVVAGLVGAGVVAAPPAAGVVAGLVGVGTGVPAPAGALVGVAPGDVPGPQPTTSNAAISKTTPNSIPILDILESMCPSLLVILREHEINDGLPKITRLERRSWGILAQIKLLLVKNRNMSVKICQGFGNSDGVYGNRLG